MQTVNIFPHLVEKWLRAVLKKTQAALLLVHVIAFKKLKLHEGPPSSFSFSPWKLFGRQKKSSTINLSLPGYSLNFKFMVPSQCSFNLVFVSVNIKTR